MKIGNTWRTRSGFSLISIALLIGIISVTLFALVSQLSSVRRVEGKLNKQIIAQTYAAELLEFFRAFNQGSTLINYLSVNPADSTLAPYYFCSLINVLDRTTNSIVNPDPIATLPPSTLDAGPGVLAANRYYMVQIIDANGASIDPAALCTSTYSSVHFDYADDAASPAGTLIAPANQLVAATNLRALITVGVSWIPTGGTVDDKQEIVLSALLPTN